MIEFNEKAKLIIENIEINFIQNNVTIEKNFSLLSNFSFNKIDEEKLNNNEIKSPALEKI